MERSHSDQYLGVYSHILAYEHMGLRTTLPQDPTETEVLHTVSLAEIIPFMR
jgi:hypothetical protein